MIDTETTAHRAPARTPLSGDGRWWWNARRWVAAESEDGIWRWDGSAWRPTVDLSAGRPAELADRLATESEQRYAQAGAILAARADEWGPDGAQRELLSHLAGAEVARGSHPDQGRLGGEMRALMARIGRSAPRPTVKEADELLGAARTLDRRASMLHQAATQLDAALEERAQAMAAAQHDLALAETSREEAIAQARSTVAEAEAEHARNVDEARSRLRRIRTPGPGELRAEFADFRLHANLLETPEGRSPSGGALALLGSPAVLWQRHGDLLADLILLGTPGAHALHQAVTAGSEELYLLIAGRTAATVVPVAAVDEAAARRFAEAVAENAGRASQAARERELRARMAQDELAAVMSDRSAIAASEHELERVQVDETLMVPVWRSRKAIEAARSDTPELTASRERLASLLGELTAPPEPLRQEEPE